MFRGVFSVLSGLSLVFAALPAGTTYKLESYGVGSGGVANSVSSNYGLEGTVGEISGTQMSGTTYKAGTGLVTTQLTNVPNAPTLDNVDNYYNKLRMTLDTGNNPSDTKFAIAISTNNFTTTQYVKADHTVGASLTIADYQTYASWGGASGFLIIGLQPSTTYQVKTRAIQGKYTESGWSPTASAATVNPSLTFQIDVSASDVSTTPPYNLTMPNLVPGTVVTSPTKIWTSFTTNGDFGGNQYIFGRNGGLKSTAVSYTINALSGDLGSANQGFGAQNATVAQASGGPLSVAAPYNGASNNVGTLDANIRQLYNAPAPITSGRTSLQLKAKVNTLTPAATDYADILTVLAAASF